ncbi:MAG: ABC transporter permease [Eubacteriales bacterium]|nr:ABC transporter permease [Eubacteriales bacterium]MDD4421627.1 ABC transporter permease [Eubacteriales bacterium]
MNQIKTVFGYTFRDAVRKKAFIISTIIIFILILVLTMIPRIINTFEDDNTDNYVGYTCYYIDEKELISGAKETLASSLPGIVIEEGSADKISEYNNLLQENKNLALITITEKDGLPFITITTGDFMSSVPSEMISETLTKVYVTNTLNKLGYNETAIETAQIELPYTMTFTGGMNFSGYTVGILLTMLIFFAIYYYGYGVSMSVATEKTSRVMETLVVSAKPSRILIGKCLGMGAVGLLQFSGIIAFSAICIKALIPEDFLIMGMPISFSAFTIKSALLVLLYFILGYSLYSVMNSVCGASVSKIEDLNSAMMPVMLISLISFYFGYVAAVSGSDGLLTKIAMLLPFSSPFIMPFKLLNGSVATVDIILSIVLLIIFIIIFAYISIRIYSASVLNYGKKQKLWALYKTKL